MMSRACFPRLQRVLSATLLETLIGLACAKPSTPPPEERALYDKALDRWLERTRQLQTINQRIRIAGEDLCGRDLSPVLGVVLIRISELPKTLRDVGKTRFGAGDGVRVIGVLDGFPAQRAGLRPGDEILAVDGARAVAKRNVYGAAANDSSRVVLRISRAGEPTELSLESRPGCSYAAELVDAETINAYADGFKVVFFNGLL